MFIFEPQNDIEMWMIIFLFFMLMDNAVFRAQSFYTIFMYVVSIWKSYEGPKHPLILPHLVFYPNLSYIYP